MSVKDFLRKSDRAHNRKLRVPRVVLVESSDRPHSGALNSSPRISRVLTSARPFGELSGHASAVALRIDALDKWDDLVGDARLRGERAKSKKRLAAFTVFAQSSEGDEEINSVQFDQDESASLSEEDSIENETNVLIPADKKQAVESASFHTRMLAWKGSCLYLFRHHARQSEESTEFQGIDLDIRQIVNRSIHRLASIDEEECKFDAEFFADCEQVWEVWDPVGDEDMGLSQMLQRLKVALHFGRREVARLPKDASLLELESCSQIVEDLSQIAKYCGDRLNQTMLVDFCGKVERKMSLLAKYIRSERTSAQIRKTGAQVFRDLLSKLHDVATELLPRYLESQGNVLNIPWTEEMANAADSFSVFFPRRPRGKALERTVQEYLDSIESSCNSDDTPVIFTCADIGVSGKMPEKEEDMMSSIDLKTENRIDPADFLVDLDSSIADEIDLNVEAFREQATEELQKRFPGENVVFQLENNGNYRVIAHAESPELLEEQLTKAGIETPIRFGENDVFLASGDAFPAVMPPSPAGRD